MIHGRATRGGKRPPNNFEVEEKKKRKKEKKRKIILVQRDVGVGLMLRGSWSSKAGQNSTKTRPKS